MFGHGELSDIMQERSGSQTGELVPTKAQFLPNLDGIDLDALQMVVADLIFGLDGQGQRFNGSKVQGRGLFTLIGEEKAAKRADS